MFLRRYRDEMVERKDTHFFVGTHSVFPTWLIVGVFYPPKTAQPPLFLADPGLGSICGSAS